MCNTIAIFDFDGTITKDDTLWLFLKFSMGSFGFYWVLFKNSPLLFLSLLGLFPKGKAKEQLLSSCFKGMTLFQFERLCNRFFETKKNIIRPEAREAIHYHFKNGSKVIILTASPTNWVKPFATSLGISKVIGTELETDVKGKLTGRFSTKNCNGIEKVKRLNTEFPDLKDNFKIYAYGDSSGDKELLAFADYPFFKKF
ncbi:HAD family hydrolase [Parasutterella excrementihominis]|uniref:HAD family hydrolase n=1 Tax=Parasutterella excrementihominis TaxID=487175 RepID=UPI00242B8EFC|nr:HAD family hydrolase [Parasutterella excrementihominis]